MENCSVYELKSMIYKMIDEFKRIVKKYSKKVPTNYLDEINIDILVKELENEDDIKWLIWDKREFSKIFEYFVCDYRINCKETEKSVFDEINTYVLLRSKDDLNIFSLTYDDYECRELPPISEYIDNMHKNNNNMLENKKKDETMYDKMLRYEMRR